MASRATFIVCLRSGRETPPPQPDSQVTLSLIISTTNIAKEGDDSLLSRLGDKVRLRLKKDKQVSHTVKPVLIFQRGNTLLEKYTPIIPPR